MYFDIFNGDADGICALHQLRLWQPRPEAQLITGVKRDIQLLARKELEKLEDCDLTVLDISLDSNREYLDKLLVQNNRVTYIDHHAATDIPQSELLTAHIQLDAELCTSLIVNNLLSSKYGTWAVCGAFGDNLHAPAQKLAAELGLSDKETDTLKEIGELLNYNGYGTTTLDLHYHPRDLYLALHPFDNPFDFYTQCEQLHNLRDGYTHDLERALNCKELNNHSKNRVYILPAAPWANRISGVFANQKAREKRNAAHALITPNNDGTLRISVRAPLDDRRDAATLCKRFPTGGGREAAAGINSMPEAMLDEFLAAFNDTYQ